MVKLLTQTILKPTFPPTFFLKTINQATSHWKPKHRLLCEAIIEAMFTANATQPPGISVATLCELIQPHLNRRYFRDGASRYQICQILTRLRRLGYVKSQALKKPRSIRYRHYWWLNLQGPETEVPTNGQVGIIRLPSRAAGKGNGCDALPPPQATQRSEING